MPDIFPRGSRRVSASIFDRDGIGGPLPDPASRKFQAVETDGFNSPVLAVIRGNEIAFRLGFPGEVMRGLLASVSVGIGAGCWAVSRGHRFIPAASNLPAATVEGVNPGLRGGLGSPEKMQVCAGCRLAKAFGLTASMPGFPVSPAFRHGRGLGPPCTVPRSCFAGLSECNVGPPGTDLRTCCLMARLIGIMDRGRANHPQPEKI